LVTSRQEIAFYNMLLKERYKGRECEEEDVGSFCMNLRKRGGTRPHYQ